MTEKWKPEVGGRAVFRAVGSTEDVPVFVCRLHSTGLWASVLLPDGRTRLVDHVDLAEHPADRRARQLVQYARRVNREWNVWVPEMMNFATRQVHEAIAEMADLVAEIDAAAADAGREEVGHG